MLALASVDCVGQEIFTEYDRDRSGALEVTEFRELLRDFNQGKEPTDEESGAQPSLSDDLK